MPVHELVDAIIDLIKKNIIAKTNVTSDVTTGDVFVTVENSFHFNNNEEIVLIDFGYSDTSHAHYNVYEYARVSNVASTTSVELYTNTLSDWLVSDQAFVQKTIGHSPLYGDNIYFGDREVIPQEDMAITVEPVSLGNEWIYIQGGLSEEYRIKIMIYGKHIQTEDGMVILSKYTDAVYHLLNSNIHMDVTDHETPLQSNMLTGSSTVVILDTTLNREKFVVSTPKRDYVLQDNVNVLTEVEVTGVSIGGGLITLTVNGSTSKDFLKSEYAVIRKVERYLYDNRVDNVQFGVVQKGSAFLRAVELSWFGKEVRQYDWPTHSEKNDYFPKVP